MGIEKKSENCYSLKDVFKSNIIFFNLNSKANNIKNIYDVKRGVNALTEFVKSENLCFINP